MVHLRRQSLRRMRMMLLLDVDSWCLMLMLCDNDAFVNGVSGAAESSLFWYRICCLRYNLCTSYARTVHQETSLHQISSIYQVPVWHNRHHASCTTSLLLYLVLVPWNLASGRYTLHGIVRLSLKFCWNWYPEINTCLLISLEDTSGVK